MTEFFAQQVPYPDKENKPKEDYYAEAAAKYYEIPVDQVTQEQRRSTKEMLMFASYGGGLKKLSEDFDPIQKLVNDRVRLALREQRQHIYPYAVIGVLCVFLLAGSIGYLAGGRGSPHAAQTSCQRR